MTIQSELESALNAALSPAHLEVVNESNLHAVPKGAETHFRVVVVSEEFEGLTLLKRHRLASGAVATIVGDQRTGLRVKAMSLNTFTPEEWAVEVNNGREKERASPVCAGAKERRPT